MRYSYLSQGLPKDQALQQAKLEFLETTSKARQLPYFWASSILLGNADKLAIDNGHSKKYFYIAGAILLIVLILFVILLKRKKL